MTSKQSRVGARGRLPNQSRGSASSVRSAEGVNGRASRQDRSLSRKRFHDCNGTRRVLLRELPREIRHEEGNYQLVERETQSVLRVASDDPLLTHSFWAFFRVNSGV
jgi:hypothetical protein